MTDPKPNIHKTSDRTRRAAGLFAALSAGGLLTAIVGTVDLVVAKTVVLNTVVQEAIDNDRTFTAEHLETLQGTSSYLTVETGYVAAALLIATYFGKKALDWSLNANTQRMFETLEDTLPQVMKEYRER